MRAQVVLAGAREGIATRLARGERTRVAACWRRSCATSASWAPPCVATGIAPPSRPGPSREVRCELAAAGAGNVPVSSVIHLPGGTVHPERAPDHRRRRGDGRPAGPGSRHELRRPARLGDPDGDLPGLRPGGAAGGRRHNPGLPLLLDVLEQHRLPPAPPGPGAIQPGESSSAQRAFLPVLSDVRGLVQAAHGGGEQRGRRQVDPERLRGVLRSRLHGEGIVVVANRKPIYIHQRAPDGTIRVAFPASGLVTALEPVMRACSGT